MQRSKKHTCEKKPIQRHTIEDLVVKEAKQFLNSDKNINAIVREVEIIVKQEKSNNHISELRKQLKNQMKRKDNLMSAVSECEDTELRKELLNKLSEVKESISILEIEMSKAEIPFNSLLPDKVRFFLKQLQQKDITDIKTRKMLVNTFVNEIYLYEDKVVIFFLTQKKDVRIEKEVIKKAESLSLETSTPPK